MAKSLNTLLADQSLNYLKNNGLLLIACTAEPTTYAQATTANSGAGFKLGDVAITGADMIVADGTPPARQITIASKTITMDESGTANHLAIVDTVNTDLLLVTTMGAEVLTATNSYDTDAFIWTINGPT